MGAIAALISKDAIDVSDRLIASISSLSHRARDGFGIASSGSANFANKAENLSGISSGIGIAHALTRVTRSDVPQPVLGPGYAYAIDGKIHQPSLKGALGMRALLDRDPKERLTHLVEDCRGEYALVVATKKYLLAARSPLGTVPLYYGRRHNLLGLASERKALWRIGVTDVKPFPPGYVAMVKRGFSFKRVCAPSKPRESTMSRGVATRRIAKLLFESVRRRSEDTNRVAVGFSGGIDSSLLANLTSRFVTTELVTVGLEDKGIERAKTAADALGLPLRALTYTVDDLRDAIPKVLWLVEEPNIMKLSIAIPFYWSSKEVSKRHRVMLSGQGSDELYGGYARHLRIYSKSGRGAVLNTIFTDVTDAHETSYAVGNKACAGNKVELRFPYADWDVVNFSLSLPLALRLSSPQDELRKRILRNVGVRLGLPKEIVQQPKKAIQYSTGVEKAIRKIAKERGLRPKAYVNRVFCDVFGF